MTNRRRLLLSAGVIGLAGCALGPSANAPIAVYDFGLDWPVGGSARRIPGVLAVDGVDAPAWLGSPAIMYRLAYREGARIQPYAHSRWAAAPASLLDQRLRLALSTVVEGAVVAGADGGRFDQRLRVELDNFVQVVDAPDQSRGVVRARATLIAAADRKVRHQRLFAVERRSPSVDAQGAVRALGEASDALIRELIDWIADHTASR